MSRSIPTIPASRCMAERKALLRSAEAIVARAAETLVGMQGGTLKTSRKDLLDVVTEADLASEEIVLDGLRRLTPDAAILSEEQGASGPSGPTRWIVDPLDGTVNYASGLPWFSVTIAYQEHGRTVLGLTHAPAACLVSRYIEDDLATVNDQPVRASQNAKLADAVISVMLTSHFSAEELRRTAAIIAKLGAVTRGVRIVVSGAFELSLVASGRLDAFVSVKADIVSHAMGLPLVRAAGGRVTTIGGRDAGDEDLEKIASNGRIHDELLAQLRTV
jgi:myo-inositol-1(or 4)-monophosphatase